METKLIDEWLKVEENSGSGYGDGSGNSDGCGGYGVGSGGGYGSGSGFFSGYGDGSGNGDGYGDGCGCGDGSGFFSIYGDGFNDEMECDYNIKKYNGHYIFFIDDVPTIITNIKGNIAKGFVVNGDLSLEKTFVAKGKNLFAHGRTVKEAFQSLQKKIFRYMNVEEKIEEFKKTFNKKDRYKGSLFFEWHNYLTGSCLQGRETFIKNRGIDLGKMYTVQEFLEIVKGAYGWKNLKELVEYYGGLEK